MIANYFGWKPWSVPRAMISSVLLRFGGMSPTAGVLGWRFIGCSEKIDRAGEVDMSRYI